jgi:rod shape-determining protein MreC
MSGGIRHPARRTPVVGPLLDGPVPMFSSSGRRIDRVTILFLSLVAVGFIVATFDVRSSGGGSSEVLREGTQSIFTPFQKGVDFVTRPAIAFVDGVSNLAGLREENERLAIQVRELESQVQATDALEEQVVQLEAISGLAAPGELAIVTARITASGPSAFDNVRYIDKGSKDGIVEGQAVVDEDGLIGRVDIVSANAARVRLITDPIVSVGVRVLSTNETGIVTGRGDGPLRLEMFRAKEAVHQGDRVVTDGSRFPPGIAVGTVRATTEAEVEFVLRGEIDPAARLSEIDYVIVVIGWSPIDAGILDGGDQISDAVPPTTSSTSSTSTTVATTTSSGGG